MSDVHINTSQIDLLNGLDYFFCKICITLAAKVALGIAYNGQENKK